MIFVLISVQLSISDCVLISIPSYTHISAHMSHPYLLVFLHICPTHMCYTYMFAFMFIFRVSRVFLFSRFYSFPIMRSLLHIIFRKNRNMQHADVIDMYKSFRQETVIFVALEKCAESWYICQKIFEKSESLLCVIDSLNIKKAYDIDKASF